MASSRALMLLAQAHLFIRDPRSPPLSHAFSPLHFGWVALPPQPKAVVLFIGGASFGTYPTLCYRGFLRILHDLDHVVVGLPFRFTFRDQDIALSLSIYLAEPK